MRFEFKMIPGKTVVKEPPQRPNVFELLKTGEKQKEIISSTPVLTDAFGRTLYQTPNGQFRAIGDIFNLVANVYQTQNNYVTLAPPPEDDEEDVMPKQKPKRKAGGIIIVPPPPMPLFPFCYIAYDDFTEQIYKTNIPDLDTKMVFSKPEGSNNNWTNLLGFGFFDNTALIFGFDKEWTETVYQVDFSGRVVRKAVWEQPQFYTAKFTYYKNYFYYVYWTGEDSLEVRSLDKYLNVGAPISSISFTGHLNTPFYIWKNFIVYLENSTIKIYDYFKNKQIAKIDVLPQTTTYFSLVNLNNDFACFVYSYIETDKLEDQHFLILKKDGNYFDIIKQGTNGGLDAAGDKAVLYYYPHYIYTSYFSGNIIAIQNEYICTNSSVWIHTKDYTYKKIIKPLISNADISAELFLDNKTLLIGTSSINPLEGARIFRFDLSTTNDPEDLGKLGTDDERGIMTLRQSPSGRLFAMTQEYYVGLEAWSHIGKAYKSDDLGEQWQLIDAYGIWDVMCFENGKIFFETNYNYWHVSADDGNTWIKFINEGRYEEPYYGVIEWRDRENVYLEAYGIAKIENNFIKVGAPTSVDIMSRRVCMSNDGGYNWTQISTIPERVYPVLRSGNTFIRRTSSPHYKEIQMLYEIDGIMFYTGIAIRNNQEIFVLYRSADGGYTWTNVWEDYPESFIRGLTKISTGIIVGFGISNMWVSDDNGLTWVEVRPKADRTYIIETYSLQNGNLLRQDYFDDCPIGQPQGDIGKGNGSKIYNNNFYLGYHKYSMNTGQITEIFNDFKGNWLWLGDFLFCVEWDSEIGSNGIVAYNMKNLIKTKIIPGKFPWFSSEHLATYYLR